MTYPKLTSFDRIEKIDELRTGLAELYKLDPLDYWEDIRDLELELLFYVATEEDYQLAAQLGF